MVTFKFFKTCRFILLILLFTIRATAAPALGIAPTDVEQFEHTYENWVVGLTQTLIPSNPATVLVTLDYSDNSEKLADYEDALNADHLPGLPDVYDPHVNMPLQNPIFALVQHQKIKVIFEKPITETQKRILSEVFESKLKLNYKAGDQVIIEQLPPQAEENGTVRIWSGNSITTAHNPVGWIFGLVILFSMLAAARPFKTQPKDSKKNDFSLPRTFGNKAFGLGANRAKFQEKQVALGVHAYRNEKSLVDHMTRINPILSRYAKNAVDPLQVIIKADTKILLAVIRNEKPAALAMTLHGLSETLAALILKLCSLEQRNEIRSILLTMGETITAEQSKYHLLLLASKVHHQTKKFQELTFSLDRFVEAQSQKDAALTLHQQAKERLAEARASQENENAATTKEADPEASHHL